MRLGISTTDFTQMPAEKLFRQISDYGHGCCVIQLGLSYLAESGFDKDGVFEIPERVSKKTILAARSAGSFGLDIVAINGTFNMAYPDPRIRSEGVRRFDALAEAAGEMGCALITLCTGTRNTSRLWAPHPENGEPSAWADMMDTMLRLVEIAERRGLTLAIETEASNIIDTPEKARRALDEIGPLNGAARVGIIMDCANLFRPGEARRALMDARTERAFDLLGERVVLAHGKDIKESDAGELNFCAAGEGMVNFPLFLRLLRERGYTGDMILHGIKDVAQAPRALAYMRSCMQA